MLSNSKKTEYFFLVCIAKEGKAGHFCDGKISSYTDAPAEESKSYF